MTARATGVVLEVADLGVELGGALVVDRASLSLRAGEVHALVGESGSGKTMTANALLGLLPPGAKVTGHAQLAEAAQSAESKGVVDLLSLDQRARAAHRGRTIAMVPQEPLTALNPVLTIGDQLLETLSVHGTGGRDAAHALLAEVGLDDPPAKLRAYPHQLSGGMRQRVLIALALACQPRVLIADEPTTALDATLRGVVLALLRSLAASRGLAVLLITHDLEIVREACDVVTVLYAGRVVEQAPASRLFAAPAHPYTAALLKARPALQEAGARLAAIPGAVPQPAQQIPGCRFNPRCPRAEGRCRAERPELREHGPNHAVSCFFPLPATTA